MRIHEESICEVAEEGNEMHQREQSKAKEIKEKMKPTFECFICKSQHQSKADVRKHLQLHGRDKQCSICESDFTENELNNHLCDSDEKEILCEYCPISFSTTISLLQHIENHEKKMYQCETCPRFFAMNRLKKLHMDNHKFKVKPYICEICSKGLSDPHALKIHIQGQHSSEKCMFSYCC